MLGPEGFSGEFFLPGASAQKSFGLRRAFDKRARLCYIARSYLNAHRDPKGFWKYSLTGASVSKTLRVLYSLMPKPKTKSKTEIFQDLSEKQLAELRAIDDRLNNALLDRRAGRASDTDASPRMEAQIGSITFRYETVRCGKQNCSRCPHGPYWYAYWKENGRTRSRYIGRTLPGAARKSYDEKHQARLEKRG